jgi:hypothetical protein
MLGAVHSAFWLIWACNGQLICLLTWHCIAKSIMDSAVPSTLAQDGELLFSSAASSVASSVQGCSSLLCWGSIAKSIMESTVAITLAQDGELLCGWCCG